MQGSALRWLAGAACWNSLSVLLCKSRPHHLDHCCQSKACLLTRLLQALAPDAFSVYSSAATQAALRADQRIITCPSCGISIERLPASPAPDAEHR